MRRKKLEGTGYESFTIMRRTFEFCTKARLSFSGGPHAPVNMADSVEEMNREAILG